MKTLTEFSGTLIRMAAKAVAEAKRALPAEARSAPAAAPTPAGLSAGPSDNADAAAPPETADSATDAAVAAMAAGESSVGGEASAPKPGEAGSDELGVPSEDPDLIARKEEADAGQDLAGNNAAAPDSPPSAAAAAPAPAAAAKDDGDSESDAARAAYDEAVGAATGMTGDRLARLREAVRAVGKGTDRVRLVRVFSGEEPVAGAKKIGEHQYLVDQMPASMKQVFERDDGKGRKGPRKPQMGGGKSKAGDSLEGSFSMDTLAQDRKNERGAPGARKPGGPGGARPGGRPGGAGPGRSAGGPGGRPMGGAGRPAGGPGGRPAGGPGGARPAGGGRPGGAGGAGRGGPSGAPKA